MGSRDAARLALLPAGIAQLRGGLVAEVGSGLAGFVAMDMAGSIPLILVAPAYQRHQIGTALLTAAMAGPPAQRRHPLLSHRLDHPRILLPPRRLPALAPIRHVPDPPRPHLTMPGQ
jgi:hypothetical protein